LFENNINMINPSAQGWVKKFLIESHKQKEIYFSSLEDFYHEMRKIGFIYGHMVTFQNVQASLYAQYSLEEKSKLGLLLALYKIYNIEKQEKSDVDFIVQTSNFYSHLYNNKENFFSKLLISSKPEDHLEKMIENRIQTNSNFVSKNFSHIVTNALLFMDVLAFYHFLKGGEKPQNYLQDLEILLLNVVSNALQSKKNKTTYDDLLIKLFEASFRYSKFSENNLNQLDQINFNSIQYNLEKYYIIDLAVMAIWSDDEQDENETKFIFDLGIKMQISKTEIYQSTEFMKSFVEIYRKDIPYFHYSNPIKHFYDNTSDSVHKILIRNKRRLTQEIMESGELVKLLALSTTRDLNPIEKKKVKKQLLDVCKSIPSLTIFLLPGGSLLLPILIKFIPQLLPSSFNENLEDL